MMIKIAQAAKKVLVLALTLCFVAFQPPTRTVSRVSAADVVYVSKNADQSPYASIQTAIDHVADGGTVFVYPGTYTETIHIKDRTVNVLSLEGPQTTIIDGDGLDSVVWIDDGADVALAGFTVENAGGEPTLVTAGYGVAVSGSSSSKAKITHNIITENSQGGGIQIESATLGVHLEVTIDGNLITKNRFQLWGSDGGGIHFDIPTTSDVTGFVTIQNNVISRNTGYGAGGLRIVACCQYGAPGTFAIDVINNTVFSNTASYGGVGGIAANSSNLRLFNNILYENSANHMEADLSLVQAGLTALITSNDMGDGQFVRTNGNIQADPLFVDAAADNLHLGPTSPCVDAGTSVAAPPYDFDGNNRPLGSAVDIGAYEAKVLKTFLPAIMRHR